ncbi:MAG: Uncharacterised protein [SAR116 cluster bacterium]|nr:MAG: Uncharacterised protein [SAR116 cluster bacterium]
MAATALGKDCLFGQQFHTGHMVFGWRTILANAHITGCHAAHGTVLVIQHFGGCKTGVDFNPKRLGLFTQPAAEIAK